MENIVNKARTIPAEILMTDYSECNAIEVVR